MYLNRVKSKNTTNFYIMKSYRDAAGKVKNETIEHLGNTEFIKSTYGVDDVEAWCKHRLNEFNEKEKVDRKAQNRTVTITLSEAKNKSSKHHTFNAGTLILDSLYHSMGLSNICQEIQAKHPHVKGFNLDNVLRSMLFGRIVAPSSKLRLVKKMQHEFVEDHDLQPQHVYRALDLIDEHKDLIQQKLIEYSTKALGGRDVARLYYDCTNFYCEKEFEDEERKGKDFVWYTEPVQRAEILKRDIRANAPKALLFSAFEAIDKIYQLEGNID